MEIATGVAPAGVVAPEAMLGPSLSGGTDFEVEVIAHPAALQLIAHDWHALEALSPAAAVFQSFAHVDLWAKHFIDAAHGNALHVAVVREQGRPVLILPCSVSGPAMLRVARIAGDPIAQFSEILADPVGASRAALDAALLSLKKVGVDALVARRVRDDSHFLRLAAPHLRPATSRCVAPYADLAAFADFDAYQKSLSKKVRQALRHRRNHLEKRGDFRFEILTAGAEARAAVTDAVDLKRKWLVQRGSLSSAFVDPATKACLLDLAESPESGAVVARLSIGGEAAAIRYGFEHGGTHFAYMSAYDARFADVSPGKLLMEHVISGSLARGFSRLDMLPPAGRHKSEWCALETGAADYTLPLTPSGRAYAEIYQERVRPALKRGFQLLPASLRTLATALFIRL